jgi:hypothetical protein
MIVWNSMFFKTMEFSLKFRSLDISHNTVYGNQSVMGGNHITIEQTLKVIKKNLQKFFEEFSKEKQIHTRIKFTREHIQRATFVENFEEFDRERREWT